jgi:hypothetical protein
VLPDGLFSNQKSQFGKILEGLGMENAGVLYGHLLYLRSFGIFTIIWYIYGHLANFMAIWYTYFVVIWYIFPPVWYFVPRIIWQP